MRLLALAPQAITHAGTEAACPAAALFGGGPRDAQRRESCHAAHGVEARHARPPAVDDDAHAFDGETGLGDRGREHPLAPTGRRGTNGLLLLLFCLFVVVWCFLLFVWFCC